MKWTDFRHIGTKRVLIAAAAGLLCGTGALAAGPAAIVEDVDAPGAGIAFMDYVESGRVILLGANGTVILGYLHSCLRETITGGTVTVGSERSEVAGGKLVRERVECDGGKLELTVQQARTSTVTVFRKPPAPAGGAMPQPAFKIYGSSPVIKLIGGAREVVIERLDRPSQVLKIDVAGKFVDLSAKGESLEPGGLYRASVGERTIVFEVDAFARPGKGPIIGRLVSF